MGNTDCTTYPALPDTHLSLRLRRDLEHNEARARQELAMREYERDLLTSLLESRVFDELD